MKVFLSRHPEIILEIDFLELYRMISDQNIDLCIYILLTTIRNLFMKEHKL